MAKQDENIKMVSIVGLVLLVWYLLTRKTTVGSTASLVQGNTLVPVGSQITSVPTYPAGGLNTSPNNSLPTSSRTSTFTPQGPSLPNNNPPKSIEPQTGLPYGSPGIGSSNFSIGMALIPPDATFGPYIDDPAFINWYNSGGSGVGLCPDGYNAEVDPNDVGVYCVLAGH